MSDEVVSGTEAIQDLLSKLGSLITDAIVLGKSGVSLSSFGEIMKVYSDVEGLAVDAKPAMAEIPSLSAEEVGSLGASALAVVQQVLTALAK